MFEFSSLSSATMTSKPPTSFTHANIIVLERVLRGPPKPRNGTATVQHKPGTSQVICYEFRGHGMPPADIGSPGDIFWDVTAPYIFYVRGINLWEAWNPGASTGSQLLAEHPCFFDRYLWISGSGLEWRAQQSLYKAKMDTKQFHILDDVFQAELAEILSSAPSFKMLALDIPENRTRHEAEVERRRRTGVAVGHCVEIAIASPVKRKRRHGDLDLDETTTCPAIPGSVSVDPVLSARLWSSFYFSLIMLSWYVAASMGYSEGQQAEETYLEFLKSENTRLHKLLKDFGTQRFLFSAEQNLKKAKKAAKKNAEELEVLRTFKTTVTDLIGGMVIPVAGPLHRRTFLAIDIVQTTRTSGTMREPTT
ncbi:hypothetical protein B0H11DRAFT_2272448 [Mycena galericulata]|nr:hypothetical protein B0H11DRAFT_2272448 [Mycena galericulata]